MFNMKKYNSNPVQHTFELTKQIVFITTQLHVSA